MTLPNGWRRTTLGELGRYLNGRAFKRAEWRDAGRPIIRIQNLTGSSETFNYFQGEADDRHVVRHGDLLVSWSATLGAYLWDGPEAVLNQHIFKVESSIDKRFHKYLLDHKLDELKRHTHGSGMVHITRRAFDSIPVDIPDLREQQWIGGLLDDHLSRVDAARKSVVASIRRSSALVTSSLGAAVTEGSADSRLSTVGAEAVQVDYGSSAKCHAESSEGDVPVLRMGNLKSGKIDLRELKFLPKGHPEFPKLLLAPGDLLFNRTNSAELVGKSAVFDSATATSFASYLIRVRFKATVDPRWANIVINSPQGRGYITSVASQQVGQANVNGTKLKAFPLPVPSLSRQRELVATHERLFDDAQRVSAVAEESLKRSIALRRSLLAAAFAGQLHAEAAPA